MSSPTNWPTPVPKMVSARPVTFWLALSVMVRKLKMSEPIAPATNEAMRAIATATAPIAPSPAICP